ncbi:MAG: tetratricopeptide repeat protein [Gemmatimonadota bacterium]
MAECPRCHALAGPEDRYCGLCGERLAHPAWRQEVTYTRRSLSLVDVHYNLGLVYARKGEYRRALEVWERALERAASGDAVRQQVEEAMAGVRRHLNGAGPGGRP